MNSHRLLIAWQATLGLDAVVFTNHPGSEDERSRPNFWAGNGILPRVAQYENVLVCIHHLPADDPFPYSHAYFPREAFDEVVEEGPWIFGRHGQGYIGLCSQHPLRWLADQHDEAHPIVELRAESPANIWLVELGEADQWGSFEKFIVGLTEATLEFDGLSVVYDSPALGQVAFGWDDPFRVAGTEIALHNYPRFDNPYCQAAFPSRGYEVRFGEAAYRMEFE